MSRSWKIKAKGLHEGKPAESAASYFIKYGSASCGWGDRKFLYGVADYASYKRKWIATYEPGGKKWGNQGIHHLFESLEVGDFIWTRCEGVYYVAQIPDNPINLFYIDTSEEAIRHDCVVQIRGINWVKCGTEESVPGSVSTYSSNKGALIRIDNNETTHNDMTATSIFSNRIINPTDSKLLIQDRNEIFSLLGPTGLEDLVAIWLFDKYGYFVIPSTNKIGTQKYEFVLVNGEKENNSYVRRRIYIQVKNGNVDLKTQNFIDLLEGNNEVWLVTTGGVIRDCNGNKEQDQIVRYTRNNGIIESISFDKKVLVDFVFDLSKHPILPGSILRFLELFD